MNNTIKFIGVGITLISLTSCSIFNNVVTREEFEQIQKGMDYKQVFNIIGSEPTDDNSENWGPYVPTILIWKNMGGSEVSVTISEGRVIQKDQKGL